MVGTRVRYAAFSFLIAHCSGLLARRQLPVLEFAEASIARWRRNAAVTGELLTVRNMMRHGGIVVSSHCQL